MNHISSQKNSISVFSSLNDIPRVEWINNLCKSICNKKSYLDNRSDLWMNSLINASIYLVEDCWEDGRAKGGWGKSEPRFMKKIQGIANQEVDSMTVSCGVIKAFQRVSTTFERSKCPKVRSDGSDLWKSVYPQFSSHYMKLRQNNMNGAIDRLVNDEEGGDERLLSYRDTAAALHIFFEIDGLKQYASQTLKFLLDHYDHQSWDNNKISTAIKTYKVLNIASHNNGNCKDQSEKVLTKIENLFDNIVHWYSCWGYTSISEDTPRYLVRLNAMGGLVEIANCLANDRKALKTKFDNILSAEICNVNETINDPNKIELSCLLFTALVRKSNLREEENIALRALAKYLVEYFASEELPMTYALATAYFVESVIEIFNFNDTSLSTSAKARTRSV